MNYFITAIEGADNINGRCFGYFNSLNGARGAVIRDTGGLHEELYQYLVIEQIDEGILRTANEIEWYQWDEPFKGWKGCLRPSEFTGICNFAIG